MSESVAEHTHHQNVLQYRRELDAVPAGMERAKLINLIAREKMRAEEEGWPDTPE